MNIYGKFFNKALELSERVGTKVSYYWGPRWGFGSQNRGFAKKNSRGWRHPLLEENRARSIIAL